MTTLRVFLLILAVGLTILGYAIWQSHHMNLECDGKNGVLVKTMQGWTCIDAKVIK